MLKSSQKINSENVHSDITGLLNIRPKLRQLLWLPWWYNMNILYLNINIRKASQETPPGPYCLEHSRLLAGFYCDRKYIDTVLRHIHTKAESDLGNMWPQAYLDIGLTLCDLGYSSDGISYIEKAIALGKRPGFKNVCMLQLCCSLYNEAKYQRALELSKTLLDKEPKNSVAKIVFEKASITSGVYKEEHTNIKKLVSEYPEAFGFLLAELYFSLKNFKAASEAFDKYGIIPPTRFWLPEYDYKKAAAYYYSDQKDKCKRQTARIKRRMKWDRFYKLDIIKKTGIESVPAIDNMINSDEIDDVFFDREKFSHYFKTIKHVTSLYIKRYWHVVILFLILFVLFLIKIVSYLL